MHTNTALLAFAALVAGTLAGCAKEDTECAAAGAVLANPAYRAELKKAVERQFEAGELGEVFSIGTPVKLPGKYSVGVAPEFRALVPLPLHERILVDARHNIAAIFVGWSSRRGVLVDVQPNHALPRAVDYGDGVSLVCDSAD